MKYKSRGYAKCPLCGQRVCITYADRAMIHYLDFNGSYYPVCEGSGQWLEVTEPRGVRWWDKYHDKE